MSTLPPALPDTIRVHFHGAWQALVMSCCSSWPTTTLTVPYLHVTRFRTSSLPSNPGPRGLYTSRQDWMIQFTRFKIALSAPGPNSPEIDPWIKGRRGRLVLDTVPGSCFVGAWSPDVTGSSGWIKLKVFRFCREIRVTLSSFQLKFIQLHMWKEFPEIQLHMCWNLRPNFKSKIRGLLCSSIIHCIFCPLFISGQVTTSLALGSC